MTARFLKHWKELLKLQFFMHFFFFLPPKQDTFHLSDGSTIVLIEQTKSPTNYSLSSTRVLQSIVNSYHTNKKIPSV